MRMQATCHVCRFEVTVPIDWVHVTDTHVGFRCPTCDGAWRWKPTEFKYLAKLAGGGAMAMRGSPICDFEIEEFLNALCREDDVAGRALVELGGRL
jgi:hypothetical protein